VPLHSTWFFGILLLLATPALLLSLYPELAHWLLATPTGTPAPDEGIDRRARLLIFVGCALPPLLAGIVCALISKRERLDCLRARVFPCPDGDLGDFTKIANTIWTVELERARTDLKRAGVYAALWATIASLALIGTVAFLPASKPGSVPPPLEGPPHGEAWFVALTVVGAVATRFLLDLGNLAIRASNGDATRRMFAEAIKGLIGSILAAIVIMLLVQLPGLKQLNASLTSAGSTTALGIGCGIAIIGRAAFEWVEARLSTLFGIARKPLLGGTALSQLDDIGDLEVERLAEEGIHSVEALVGTSIPRVFLGTRFSLQRIVNWHDAGLLIARVGADAAKELRTRWGIRGSVEVMRSFASAELRDTLKPIFQKTLRVDNEKEAELVLHHLSDDARVKLTHVMRHTIVEWQAPTAVGAQAPPA
jgi:hypothetical protein